MSRDFRAEAIQRKKIEKEQERASAPYSAPIRSIQHRPRPAGLSEEQWRADCEARWFLDALPNKQQRQKYLRLVEEKRGAAGRMLLEDDARVMWEKRKA